MIQTDAPRFVSPELSGHGIGLRPRHFPQFLATCPALDFIEATSENFMVRGGRGLAVLEKVRRDLPVALHGVSLSIGASDPLDERYLRELDLLVQRIEPVIVSDHLCWGRHGGRYVHDLWPLPFDDEALAHVVRRVLAVQDRLRRPILLENVSSYVTFRASTLTEWEFLAAVAERSGCGILLDVNNVYVSSRNHGFDPRAYIAALPRECVQQIHLAGHTDHGSYVIDTHDAPVSSDVWSLYAYAIERLGGVPTSIEWDDNIPDLEVVLAESARAAAISNELLGRKETAA